jgi:SulP family sulfate permease
LCETRILDNSQHNPIKPKSVLELIIGLSDIEINRLKDYLVSCKVSQGELISSIGEDSNEVFLLESCTASAYILDSDNTERRIDGAGQGAIYGEIGFFLNVPRTATVRADSDGELFSLNRNSLKRMELEEPRLAAAVNRYMLKIVTERLASTTRSLRTVL